MTKSPHLGLPLVASAQAQKHVTVNEALLRLDALTALTLTSRTQTTPPSTPQDGACFAVPAGAGGDWSGSGGRIAIRINGGWEFVDPAFGWRAWIIDENVAAVYDGAGWFPGMIGELDFGAGTAARIAIEDHTLDAAAASETSAIIPDKAVVLGVTARVTSTISGTGGLSSWSLGVEGSENRYGSGYGLDLNSYAHGLTSKPTTYFGDTSLFLTTDTGEFTGGSIRIAVHYFSLRPPSAV